LIIGFVVQLLWVQLCDLSFLTINSMISLSTPGIASVIQAAMLKYAYFDIMYTEFWLEDFLATLGLYTDQVKGDEPLSLVFENNGFGSKQFLKNAGSSLVYIALFLFAWFVVLLLWIASKCSSKAQEIHLKLKNALMWNQSLNFLLS
jgi:hypothetical protein